MGKIEIWWKDLPERIVLEENQICVVVVVVKMPQMWNGIKGLVLYDMVREGNKSNS